jgi:hypothetical protein
MGNASPENHVCASEKVYMTVDVGVIKQNSANLLVIRPL